jgi:hypothetical protein
MYIHNVNAFIAARNTVMVDDFVHFHTHIAGKMVHWRVPLNHSFHISELNASPRRGASTQPDIGWTTVPRLIIGDILLQTIIFNCLDF